MKANLLKFLARICLLLCCFTALETQVFGGLTIRKPNLYIISIGINKYESNQYSGSLKFTKNDAQSIADEFEKRGKYKYETIEKVVLLDEKATKADILGELESIAKKATKEDIFIFSFAGLGNSFVSEFYLCPSDFKFNKTPNNAFGDLETAISNATLQSYFRKIRASSKLIILDSGKFLVDKSSIEASFTDENVSTKKDVDAENFILISSDTDSYEVPELQNGSVTAILLDGLRGNADYNNDGEFSFREIEAFLYLNGINYSAKYKKNFHPIAIIKNNFNIALTDNGLAKQAEIAKVEENIRKTKFEISTYLKQGENIKSFAYLNKYLEKEEIFMNLNKSALVVNFKNQDIRKSEVIYLEELPDLAEFTKEVYEEILKIFAVKSMKIVKKTDKTVFVEKTELMALSNQRHNELEAEITQLKNNPSPEMQKYLDLLSKQLNLQQSLDILLGIKTALVPTRSEKVELDDGKKNEERDGEDYGLLFYNQKFDDDSSWRELKNPRNDVEAIAKELKETYGFKEVEIKANLTTAQIYETIETYQNRKFAKPQDQLFIFFAGHGYADKENNGYYIGKDSPSATQSLNTFANRRLYENKFVQIDTLLKGIDRIEINHIMIVFDICYGGVIWKPVQIQKIEETAKYKTKPIDETPEWKLTGPNIGISLDFTNAFDDNEPRIYAKKKMKNKSRIVMTSGDKPVYDSLVKPDGRLSDHSPFADAFIRALQTKGSDDKVLITPEFVPFIDKLDPMPQRGRLSGSDGDFVFVLAETKPSANPR